MTTVPKRASRGNGTLRVLDHANAPETADAWSRRPEFVDAAMQAYDADNGARSARLPEKRLHRFAGKAVVAEVRTLAHAASILAFMGGCKIACPALSDLRTGRNYLERNPDALPGCDTLLETAVGVMLGRDEPVRDALRLARAAAARLGDVHRGLGAFPMSPEVADALALAREVCHLMRLLGTEPNAVQITGRGERARLWRHLCAMAADLIVIPQSPSERAIACWMVFTEAARIAGAAGRTLDRAADEFAARCPRDLRRDDIAAVVRKALAALGHSAGAFANAHYQKSRNPRH